MSAAARALSAVPDLPAEVEAAPKRKRRQRRDFGRVERLPSGKWRARYWHGGGQHNAPTTFVTRADADVWLATEQARISGGGWLPPSARPSDTAKVLTVAEHLATVIADRDRPRTRQEYARMLRRYIAPTALGKMPLAAVTLADVKAWHRECTPGKATQRARAYSLLALGFNTAVKDRIVPESPCRIEGAAKAKRKSKTRVATPAELDVIRAALPEKWRLLADVGAWAGLRFGEAIELRRGDFDPATGLLSVERAVARIDADEHAERDEKGDRVVAEDAEPERGVQAFDVDVPKAESIRDVYLPASIAKRFVEHLAEHVGPRRDALLFYSVADRERHLSYSTFHAHWVKGVTAAGRTDLRFHDLRHTAGTRATQQGATTAEVMAFLGHSTTSAAMRYQHAEKARLSAIADRMDRLATGEEQVP